MGRQFAPEDIFLTDENDADVVFNDRLNCALNLGLRGMIPAHGVDGYGQHEPRSLGFCDFDHFAAGLAVLAALGANTMGELRLKAMGAIGEAGDAQGVVSAAGGGAALGVTSFRIRHGFRSVLL
jgi:hypothetical protein